MIQNGTERLHSMPTLRSTTLLGHTRLDGPPHNHSNLMTTGHTAPAAGGALPAVVACGEDRADGVAPVEASLGGDDSFARRAQLRACAIKQQRFRALNREKVAAASLALVGNVVAAVGVDEDLGELAELLTVELARVSSVELVRAPQPLGAHHHVVVARNLSVLRHVPCASPIEAIILVGGLEDGVECTVLTEAYAVAVAAHDACQR
eukprot:CAMPEP_0181303692 /NCGR_PEP_ID=MMETSP1101-20121128/8706_1 /TAXON_ID=46948 /ORGANISM="Rhodomonas abbreviata, Strain Caron Lab Isolate" /LENGTH=206 /DNA_ID=CAMNT_0023409307 /DNA_START=61 /DNA_END=679 /DNA_ORIENTATION=+